MLLLPSLCNADAWIGKSLSEVLRELRASGVAVVFSSQLVNEQMLIQREPANDASPLERLREVLRPFGLTTRTLPSDIIAIVRDSAPVVQPPPSLDPRTQPPDEAVIVEASRYTVERDPPTAAYTLVPQQFDATPGIDEDALRALQHIPGTVTNGLTARAHIRGSYEDQLLVRFDGMRLYDPFHLKDFLGLFSLIDPELVESIDYYSGGFPVAYGDRSAAVMDIQPRRAREPVSLLVGASVLNSRVIGNGSFADSRGEWLVGLRRSNLNNALRVLDRDVGEPEFDDALVRTNFAVTDSNIVKAGFLRSDDRIHVFTSDQSQQADVTNTDTYAWAGLDTAWSAALASHTQFSTVSIITHRVGRVQQSGIVDGNLEDRKHATLSTLSSDWKLGGQRWRWQWGAQVDRGHASYDYRSTATYAAAMRALFDLPTTRTQLFDFDPHGWNYAAYVTSGLQMGRWAIETGLRWDDARYVPNGSRLSPRLSVRYQLDTDSIVRLSLGRYTQVQALSEAREEDSVPHFDRPESSRQLILGYERHLPAELLLRIEAYETSMKHVRARPENLVDPLVLLPEIEPDRVTVAPRSSRARGLEMTLGNSAHAPLDWWITYSLAKVLDDFGTAQAPRSWDQQHTLAAGAIWANSRWVSSAIVGWHSGWPATSLEDLRAAATSDAGQRNRSRFENYFSLDLRTQYSWPLQLGTLQAALEMRNATNHSNQCCRRFDVSSSQPLAAADMDRVDSFGILPIVSVDWRFP